MWEGIAGVSGAAVGTLQNKETPVQKGTGVRGIRNRLVQTGLTGLEPATSGVTDRHSNQLSSSPKPLCGAPGCGRESQAYQEPPWARYKIRNPPSRRGRVFGEFGIVWSKRG